MAEKKRPTTTRLDTRTKAAVKADILTSLGFVRCVGCCGKVRQKLWTELAKNPANAGLCCGTLREVVEPKEQTRLEQDYAQKNQQRREEAEGDDEGSDDAGPGV